MDIEDLLSKYGIQPDPVKDQFFLADEKVVQKMVDFAGLKKSDCVLEIGAGTGILTRELAKKAGRVISFEVDKRFAPFLSNLPKNVEMHFEDAHEFVSQGGKFPHKKTYNKVVANIPFSIGEWLLHNLPYVVYDKVILLVSIRFFFTIKKNPIFSSFYSFDEKLIVDKKSFYPIPKTNSVILDLKKLPDPILNNNKALYLRQFIYANEEWKVKNSLREGLIKYEFLTKKKRLSKNEARALIAEKNFDEDMLEKPPTNKIYLEINEKF